MSLPPVLPPAAIKTSPTRDEVRDMLFADMLDAMERLRDQVRRLTRERDFLAARLDAAEYACKTRRM